MPILERGFRNNAVILGICFCGAAIGMGSAMGVRSAGALSGATCASAAPDAGVSTPDRQIAPLIQEISAANIERTVRTLASFGTRSVYSASDNPTHGIGAAEQWLYQQFLQIQAASGGRLRVEEQSFPMPAGPGRPSPTPITNLIATLPGSSPAAARRVYIISGHYDSRCSDVANGISDAPGADDDGSGVAAVLETARVMASRQFPATLVFMAVSGEEEGLWGSAYFAAQATQQQTDVEGMFTDDIIGASLGQNGVRDNGSVRLFCAGGTATSPADDESTALPPSADNDTPSCQLARFAKEAGERAVPGFSVNLIYRLDRFGRGGDQIPFLQRGYPAVRFTEPNEDLRHQHQDVRMESGVRYGDLPEFVDFSYTAQVARVNAATLAALATAPAAPRDVTLAPSAEGGVLLQWALDPDPTVSGYEVVWRSKSEALWTHASAVGKADRYLAAGLSPAEYLFGVRAVDGQGNRGPVSFARGPAGR